MGARPPLVLFPVWNADHPTQPPYFSIHEAATLEITLACSLNVISNEPFSTLLVLGCPYSSFAKTEVWGHCTWLPTWTCHEDDPEPSWYFSQGLLLPCEWSSSGWCFSFLVEKQQMMIRIQRQAFQTLPSLENEYLSVSKQWVDPVFFCAPYTTAVDITDPWQAL